MTREEIQEQIEKLEAREFERKMKDRWSNDDYIYSHNNKAKIERLKKQLEECDV